MKKKDIPKPRFSFGDPVAFYVASEGNNLPKLASGKIETITVKMNPENHQIKYNVSGHDEELQESQLTLIVF